jgi:hypothetical protein
MNLISGSETRLPTLLMMKRVQRGHEEQADRQHRHEQDQEPVEVGEQSAQRQHRPEVVDEARCENHLAQLGLVQSGLDHHRVHHCD